MRKLMMAEMTGWEFLTMVKKLRWKRKTKSGYEWHQGDAKWGEPSELNYVNFAIKRQNFIGWDYWFDKPFPDEYFDEKTEIYYPLPEGNWRGIVERFLEEHGFHEVDINEIYD